MASELDDIIKRFGISNPPEGGGGGVRSNKTMKPGRLARKVWERQGGIRSAVIGGDIGPPGFEGPRIGRTGPGGGIHANAIENMLTAQYGRNVPDKLSDSVWNAFGRGENFQKRMGFTTRNERFVSREEASKRAKAANPELSKGYVEHSGGMQIDRIHRQGEIGDDALLGEERRAPGKRGEAMKKQKGAIAGQLEKLDAEEADLKRKNVVDVEKFDSGSTMLTLKKTREPTMNYSPDELRYEYKSTRDPDLRRAIVDRRLKDIQARRETLQRGQRGQRSTGMLATKARGRANPFVPTDNMTPAPVRRPPEPVIKKEPFHVKTERMKADRAIELEAARVRANSPTRLGQLVRRLKGGGMRALGPVGAFMEPGETIGAIKDVFSGDPDRQMKAAEHFQGLPERSTGRGYTEEEKAAKVRPWYDPSRREGGI